MDEPATPRTGGGHVVLCGLNELGYRTLEELARMGAEVVVVVRAAAADLAAGARALGATLVQGSYRDESVLRAAGVPTAAAMVVTEDDDVGNLHAALTAHDLNPALRIRLRMFNQELGRRVERLFRDCQVLDAAALVAPAFVAAAVHRNAQQAIEVGVRALAVVRLRVAPGSRAAGRPVGELERATRSRVLLLEGGGAPSWRPPGGAAVAAGGEVVVVVPRGELGTVLAWTEAGVGADRDAMA